MVVRLPRPPEARRARKEIIITAPLKLYVPRVLEQRGLAAYEPETIACFLAALEFAPPGAVYDVGANVGLFSLLARVFSNRDTRAFEPEPAIAEIARGAARDSRLQYRVEQIALGDQSGTATLYLSDLADCSNSLRADFRPSSHQVRVKVETLDEYATNTGTVPAVIKLDTETTEPDVLRGSWKTLSEHRPWILCEVLPDASTAADLTRMLRPLGYIFYHVGEQLPYRPRREIGYLEREAFRTGEDAEGDLRMWLMLPHPPPGGFWRLAEEWRRALDECRVERPEVNGG